MIKITIQNESAEPVSVGVQHGGACIDVVPVNGRPQGAVVGPDVQHQPVNLLTRPAQGVLTRRR